MEPDAVAAGRTVCGWGGWRFNDAVGLLPTQLGVVDCHEWQLCPGDVLCSFHHPL